MKILQVVAGVAIFGCGPALFKLSSLLGDRWMYPFNGTPGTRTGASVFGAVGEADFDDRDAQFFVRFDTTGTAAAGLDAENYAVGALRLTLTTNQGETLTYDPTEDALETYDGTVADGDAGRPLELFGVGSRNGQTAAGFDEGSAFTSLPPTMGPPGQGENRSFTMRWRVRSPVE